LRLARRSSRSRLIVRGRPKIDIYDPVSGLKTVIYHGHHDLQQGSPPGGVDHASRAPPNPLLLPEMVGDVGHHHLVEHVLRLHQVLDLRIKLGVDLWIFSLHQRWFAKKPPEKIWKVVTLVAVAHVAIP